MGHIDQIKNVEKMQFAHAFENCSYGICSYMQKLICFLHFSSLNLSRHVPIVFLDRLINPMK